MFSFDYQYNRLNHFEFVVGRCLKSKTSFAEVIFCCSSTIMVLSGITRLSVNANVFQFWRKSVESRLCMKFSQFGIERVHVKKYAQWK